jgi:small GTP-binding protein
MISNVELKLILIGASAVGKTSFCNRIKGADFQYTQLSTIGIDLHLITLNVNKQTYHLQIWDTAGHERYKSVTNAYYRGSDIALLCFDVTNRTSLIELMFWVTEIKEATDNETVLFLIGMKSDLESIFSTGEIEQFMIEYDILSYTKISSKTTNGNFHDILQNIVTKFCYEMDERKFINNTYNGNIIVPNRLDDNHHIKCCYFI